MPAWLSPNIGTRIERHFVENRPDVQPDRVRAALASVHPAVKREICQYLNARKFHEAETLLLQYVVDEDHTSLIRAAERPRRLKFGRDSHSFGSLMYWVAVVIVLLMAIYLVPWLFTGHLK